MFANNSDFLMPFAGAIEASLSILLTIFYGLLAAQYSLMNTDAAKQISRTSVRIFLPALLMTNLGSQLQPDNILRYIPILIWALFYNLVSLTIGRIVARIFNLPRWVVLAIAFNNSSALPLLLVQSLDTSGVLSPLLMSPGDSPSDALDRARSYFLVSAVVSNTLTFGAGPSLLKGHDEDAPDDPRDDQAGREPPFRNQGGEENQSRGGEEDQGDNSANNRTSLLPDHLDRHVYHLRNRVTQVGQRLVRQLPWPLRRILRSLYHFLNPPFIGAVIGVTIGLVPPLHQLFFAQTGQGGYLNAWLTESVKRIGELFVTLQVVVVGIKLSLSFRKAKRGQDTGNFPWGPLLFTVFLRFVLWPAASISLIWVMVGKTSILAEDPMLWFTMMLMPVGPTAMKLMALADVSHAEAKEKMVISKFLAGIYGMTPLISLAVVGSLKAAQAAKS